MTPPKLAVPPGRAGRIWLVRRLDTARRGADLLDRKLRILESELTRLQVASAEAAAEWNKCQADARTWLLRAAMLSGERAIWLADDGHAADVRISYRGRQARGRCRGRAHGRCRGPLDPVPPPGGPGSVDSQAGASAGRGDLHH